MQIGTIEIQNFRNITNCTLSNSNMFVILVKNNSGKSSVLKSIYYSMNLLLNIELFISKTNFTKRKLSSIRSYIELFDCNRDMKRIDGQRRQKHSTFRVRFLLSENEQAVLKKIAKGRYEFESILEYTIDYDHENNFDIKLKTNPNGRFINNTEKVLISCQFLSERLNVDYIPSIRTEDNINLLIRGLVNEQLNQLSSDFAYHEAFETVKCFENSKLDELSQFLLEKLKDYLPNISAVKIERLERKQIRREEYRFVINDGIETDIDSKGDGIKSLVAMSLLQRPNSNCLNMLLIDEPEAHLHSGAIRELKQTILSNPDNSVVFISTHSPIFVDRNTVTSNYIVHDGVVERANHVNNIRSLLGIEAKDNLMNAEIIVLVEGVTDREILTKALKLSSVLVSQFLDSGTLVIKELGGTDNLKFNLDLYNHLLCKVIVVLDYEGNTRELVKQLVQSQRIENKDVLFVEVKQGCNRELENIINYSIITTLCEQIFGVDVSQSINRYGNLKMSDRIDRIMRDHNREISTQDIGFFKEAVMNEVIACQSYDFLNDKGIHLINELIDLIKTKIC